MTLINITTPQTGRLSTLDELWAEAETLGILDIDTEEDWSTGEPKGYDAVLKIRIRGNRVRIERKNRNLQCAIADVITEARHMGAGELP